MKISNSIPIKYHLLLKKLLLGNKHVKYAENTKTNKTQFKMLFSV